MAVFFDAVGKIYPVKETEKFKAVEVRNYVSSGWSKKTIKFNLRTNTGSSALMEISALYRSNGDGMVDPDHRTYSRDKGWILYSEKGEYVNQGNYRITLLNQSPYRVENVLKAYEEGRISTTDADKYNLHTDEEYNSLKKTYDQSVKRFLFDIDYVNYVEKLLANYDKYLKDKVVKVSGEWVFEYSSIRDTVYKKFVPNHLSYCYDEQPKETITLKIPFIYKGKSPIVIIDDKMVLAGYTPYYCRDFKSEKFKGKYLDQLEIIVPEKIEKAIQNRFVKEDPTVTSKYKIWSLIAEYINGAEKRDIEEIDLTPDEKFDIECGFRTLEEIKEEHAKADGTSNYNSNKVYGDKVTEIRLIKCGEKGLPENAEYEDGQTERPTHEVLENIGKSMGNDSNDEDVFDDVEI